jgi:hypothetical protein
VEPKKADNLTVDVYKTNLPTKVTSSTSISKAQMSARRLRYPRTPAERCRCDL